MATQTRFAFDGSVSMHCPEWRAALPRHPSTWIPRYRNRKTRPPGGRLEYTAHMRLAFAGWTSKSETTALARGVVSGREARSTRRRSRWCGIFDRPGRRRAPYRCSECTSALERAALGKGHTPPGRHVVARDVQRVAADGDGVAAVGARLEGRIEGAALTRGHRRREIGPRSEIAARHRPLRGHVEVGVEDSRGRRPIHGAVAAVAIGYVRPGGRSGPPFSAVVLRPSDDPAPTSPGSARGTRTRR